MNEMKWNVNLKVKVVHWNCQDHTHFLNLSLFTETGSNLFFVEKNYLATYCKSLNDWKIVSIMASWFLSFKNDIGKGESNNQCISEAH